MAGLRNKPLAQAEYHGKALTIEYKSLQATLHTEASNDSDVCHVANREFVLVDLVGDPHRTPCRAVLAQIVVDGKNLLTATVALLDNATEVDELQLRMAIRRLDPTTALPQVVISGYTGGAHCCTATAVATVGAAGRWQLVDLGSIDGDGGFDFLDLNHDGSAVFVDIAGEFLYRFASYAGSNAPTRIRRLTGTAVEDVTRDSRYHSFLLGELKAMERAHAQDPSQEVNGYLAGWVAQKALVGEFEDAWPVMLASYDHGSTDGLSRCAVDERVWDKQSGLCPDDQEILDPFPEVLALFLVEQGYITSAQSTALGYDPVKIAANRKTATNAATDRYEQQMSERWFIINREGICVLARAPASPAELITGDRAKGLEDDITALETDQGGKPLAVRVSQPRGGGLVSTLTFYRGSAKCEAVRQRQHEQLENLR